MWHARIARGYILARHRLAPRHHGCTHSRVRRPWPHSGLRLAVPPPRHPYRPARPARADRPQRRGQDDAAEADRRQDRMRTRAAARSCPARASSCSSRSRRWQASRRLRDYALSGADAPLPHEVEAIADQLGIDLDRRGRHRVRRRAPPRRDRAARWRRTPTCCCSTSRPTISISPRSNGSRNGSARFTGAFVVISHDRTFLTRLTSQTLWLDRGGVRRAEIGYGGFEAWTEQVYAEEERNAAAARRQAQARGALAAARRHRAAPPQPGPARQAHGNARERAGDDRPAGHRRRSPPPPTTRAPRW